MDGHREGEKNERKGACKLFTLSRHYAVHMQVSYSAAASTRNFYHQLFHL